VVVVAVAMAVAVVTAAIAKVAEVIGALWWR